jgi:probable F420-dependent oxidoreductase
MTAHPIRIGVQVEPQHVSYAQMRDVWVKLEGLGVDVVYNWDHFFPLEGDPEGRHYECWTALGSMAVATQTIRFGPLVACNSYRNPQLLADMARTVDHISGGRLILGLGSGWFERDYDEYGYEFGTTGGRLRQLEAALPLIEGRLARLNPPPVQPRIPIMIGGGGEKITLKLVARHADMWNYFGTHEEVAHKIRVLDDWCEREGRDPALIERSVTDLQTCTTADLDGYLELGVTQMILPLSGPDWDFAQLQRMLDWRDIRVKEFA